MTTRHLHFNDSQRQSFREDMILWAQKRDDVNYWEIERNPDAKVVHFFAIHLTVDLPAEIDFTTGLKKREVILNYHQDKDARDRDLDMFRLSSVVEAKVA